MRVNNSTGRFAGFVQELQESFWGDFQGRTRELLKKLLEADAEQRMAEYLGLRWHERSAPEQRVDYRNGFYERDYVTPLGVLRLRIPRTRLRSFLPRCLEPLQRRAPEVAELIRQAFLRGISTRQVGRVVAVLTGEPVSAQTVSKLTRVLDRAVEAFHGRRLADDCARRRVAEGAPGVWAAAGVVAGGLRNSPRWTARVAGLHAGQERKPSGLGRPVERPVSPRTARRAFAIGDHRRLPGLGAGLGNGLSTGTPSALLGA